MLDPRRCLIALGMAAGLACCVGCGGAPKADSRTEEATVKGTVTILGKPATKDVGRDGRVSFHHHEVVGARLTKARMKALRYPKDVTSDVVELVALHLRFYGYGRGEWTDSAVRRYVTDAGDLLPRLHKLTRSDVTTRNRRKAAIRSVKSGPASPSRRTAFCTTVSVCS